ncbi:MAG: ATP-binding protein [Candidatus Zixiibacteriota bacterium]
MKEKRRLKVSDDESKRTASRFASDDKTGLVLHADYRQLKAKFEDLNRQLKQTEEEMLRMKTLASLGEMAAVVVHELKNPLGGIRGFAELLDRDLEEGDPRKRSVGKIMQGVETMDRIVKSLLDYSKPVKLSQRKVEMAGMIDEAISFFEMDDSQKNADVRITKNYQLDDVWCQLDAEQFRQILLNLLHNATQAMTEGGEISVDLSPDKERTDIDPGKTDQTILLKISDTGTGMSKATLEKLFTPFFTTKQGGTGLGLSTVKKIVEAHKGEIQIQSELGKGTTVTLKLPRAL